VSAVVVVGAGLGGLAAAARLAALGHSVTVCEAAATVGGKLGVLERDGFTFDTGPSLLTVPDLVTDLFTATGGAADFEIRPVDPACSYRFADGTELTLPHDVTQVPASIEAVLGRDAAQAWRRWQRHSRRVWDLVAEPVLRQPLSIPAVARMSMRPADLAAVAPWRTIAGAGRRAFADPRMRMWLNRYATYSGSDPRRTPAVLAVSSFVEQEFGAWYVRGGLRRIVESLAHRCEELGVDIRTDSRVHQLLTTDGRVVGVRCGDDELAADLVVSDADAEHLYGALIGGAPSSVARRVRRTARSMAGFVLLLGLSGRSRGAEHRVYFPRDYDAEFDAIFGRHPHPVVDPTVYVHAPDDPALRPDDGSEGWFVLVNAPAHDPGRGMDWDEDGLAARYADRVLDVLAERGVDVRPRLRFTEIITPADLERRAGAPGGAIYGTASHGPRAALRRPANRSPVPGLFLVGGSAHPGGGIPLVLMSAEIVAGLIGPAETSSASSAAPPTVAARGRRPRPRSRRS
jgi:phytoene desaturase